MTEFDKLVNMLDDAKIPYERDDDDPNHEYYKLTGNALIKQQIVRQVHICIFAMVKRAIGIAQRQVMICVIIRLARSMQKQNVAVSVNLSTKTDYIWRCNICQMKY